MKVHVITFGVGNERVTRGKFGENGTELRCGMSHFFVTLFGEMLKWNGEAENVFFFLQGYGI